MIADFLSLLSPHLGLVGTQSRCAGRVHSQSRALAATGPEQGADLDHRPVPAAIFSEYEFADDQLAVVSSSIVLDYRAPK